MTELPVPDGFQPIKRLAPFLDMVGPIYVKSEGKARIVAVRIDDKHLNMRGIAHGGLLVTLADSALGINLSYFDEPPKPMVTVNLSTDFLQPAMRGDWLEAHVKVQRVGAHLAFASCDLRVDDRTVLRASGVFFILGNAGAPMSSKERFDG